MHLIHRLLGGRRPLRSNGFLARLARDTRGLAAVELALIAPVMIAAYFGMAEVSMAMMAHRRASHAAAAVGDLVTQSVSMNDATITDIFSIGTTMMRPFDTAPLKMRVTSVKMDASNNIKVVWSKTTGGMAAQVAGTTIVNADLSALMAPNQSMVITDMGYQFTSPFQRALPDALNFSDTTYLKPRKSDEVVWSTS